MIKDCWAVKSRHGLVNQTLDGSQPVHTALFKTRKHAVVWLEENPYWAKLGAYPVKVKVSIEEV